MYDEQRIGLPAIANERACNPHCISASSPLCDRLKQPYAFALELHTPLGIADSGSKNRRAVRRESAPWWAMARRGEKKSPRRSLHLEPLLR